MRLLLLGPGGVGKSTLFRQIKLHQTDEGFSEEGVAKPLLVGGYRFTQMVMLRIHLCCRPIPNAFAERLACRS